MKHIQLSENAQETLQALEYRRRYEEALIVDGHDVEEIREQMMISDQEKRFERKARIFQHFEQPSNLNQDQDKADSCHLYEASRPHLFHRLCARLHKAFCTVYKPLED